MNAGPFRLKCAVLLCAIFLFAAFAQAAQSKYVVIDQDAVGPAGTDMNSMLVFLQSPEVNVLGITVVTGDGWRNEEVAHTLRLLELIGRTDVPVIAGAETPMVRTKQWTSSWEQMYGKVLYQGAWTMPRSFHNPEEVSNLAEGNPTIKAATEDAAHFLVRMVHKYPHQVTIYAAGPMTNIATAILIDPEFASLAQELVIMGGSMNPHTDDPEYLDSPRHEFNLWFDPEASSIMLHAPWAKITVTTVDVSIENNRPKIHRVTIAVDPGIAVNPLTIESQFQGGVSFGVSQLMAKGAITLKDGYVEQSNFDTYTPPYIMDAPTAVGVHIVPSTEKPSGCGEPPVPVISPAVVNALSRLTGKRYRSLPLVEL